MSFSQTHFQNAHHFEVHNGQFTNNTVVNNHDAVLTVLWPHVAADAIFDSAARYAAGKCHPGTRTRMIGSITDWIKDFETTKRLLWLYGPAGAGKSALAHTICELLQQSYPDVYGGSFFFASGSSDRGNANKLFSTLAYQLAIHFPPMRKEINDVLAKDPSLPTKSIEVQLFSLIVQPLLHCQILLSKSPLLIVDGLDECSEAEGITQSKIVSIIGQAIVDHNLPLRFMIASRPEYWIRDVFGTARLASITLLLSLRDDVDADTDIRTYLAEGFKTIHLENNRTMRSVVPPWPSTKILDQLVYEASGQYVYASTVLKFVGKSSRYHNPQEQLRIITCPGPHRASAFSELDALYMKILSAYPECKWATMKRVLAFHLSYYDIEIPILAVQTLLGISQNEFLLILDALSALIDIQNHKPSMDDQNLKGTLVPNGLFGNLYDGCEIISFCHRSFGEFLDDAKRSKSFYIDLSLDPIPAEMLNEGLRMIYRNMEQNYQVAPYRYLNITLATYTCMQAVITICAAVSNIGVLLKPLRHMSAALRNFDPGRVVHTRSLFDFLQDMEPLQSIAQSLPDDYPSYSMNRMTYAMKTKLQHPETLDEMKTVCDEFRECVNLAYRRAFCALPFCSDFRATPALVYLLEYCHAEHDNPPPLTLPGVGDLQSTMQQYGHVLWLRYNFLERVWFFVGRNMNQIFNGGDEPGWRATGIWRDCHSELAHHSLNYVLRKDDPDYITAGICVDLLREFFGRSVSDIYGIEYFQNPNNLAILSAITGPALFWSDRQEEKFRIGGRFDWVILPPIFYWINRQLTNTQVVTLLRDHDQSLLDKLRSVMGDIFQVIFLEPLLENNKKGLCAFNYGSAEEAMSIKIKVRPLPGGLYYEQLQDIDQFFAYHVHSAVKADFRERFHNEYFGNLAGTDGNISTNCLIDSSRWHTHLAFALLRLLVSFLYGLVYPNFERRPDREISDKSDEVSFQFLIQCMPYAHPTPENLDAIRAIVYLYPHVKHPWTPPEGLWTLVVRYLKKYDRTMLSSEELGLFVKWLNSEDHADIKTYMIQ